MPLFPTGEPGQDGYGTFLQTLGTNGSPLVLTTDADKYLPKADLIIVATNSVEELIAPTMLKHGCVVCDLSRPANVSHRVRKNALMSLSSTAVWCRYRDNRSGISTSVLKTEWPTPDVRNLHARLGEAI